MSDMAIYRQLCCYTAGRRYAAGYRMLVPVVGLFIACTIFTFTGAILLAITPQFRTTLASLGLFVTGAVPTAYLAAIAYGKIFADSTRELHGVVILGLFGAWLVAGACGGFLALLAYRWLTRMMGLSPKSSTPDNRYAASRMRRVLVPLAVLATVLLGAVLLAAVILLATFGVDVHWHG